MSLLICATFTSCLTKPSLTTCVSHGDVVSVRLQNPERSSVSPAASLSHATTEWVDVMCSASRTSPGLARQEVFLQAAAVARRWVGSSTAALTHSSPIKEACVKICLLSFLLKSWERSTWKLVECHWLSLFFHSGSSRSLNVQLQSEKHAEFI